MKVIYLHQYFLTPAMAGGTRSYEMARRLVKAGHEVHMVTSDRQAREATGWRTAIEDGINVHYAAVSYSNHMGVARRLVAFVRFAVLATVRAARLDGDVVFATSTPLTIAIPALLASKWKRIPFVFEVRDMWPDVPIALGAIRHPVLVWLARRLEITAYRHAAHVVALAPGMRSDIIAKGIPAGKVSVIPNGCDASLFARAHDEASPRDKFLWLGRRKLVLYAGALGQANGVSYLVRVAAAVRPRDPEVRFVVIGEGRDLEAVKELARQKAVLNENFFMLEAMPKRDLVTWFNAADLTVSLFTGPDVVWKDGVQNKFFDSLAAGTPVASNFDGWQSRVAVEEGVGLTLDATDIETAARQVVTALHDEAWLSAVPARARTLALGRFNRDRLALRLEEILDGVVNTGGRRADTSAVPAR